MSRITVSQSVREAVAQDPDLSKRVAAIRERMGIVDEPVSFAVGASTGYGRDRDQRYSADPGNCTWPPAIPGCYDPSVSRNCDMDIVSVGMIVTGGSTFEIQMEPDSSAWFQPRAVNVEVRDAENPQQENVVLFTAVTVNKAPVYPTNITAPVAPALANNTAFSGWWSTEWRAQPGMFGVKVNWPIFSDLTNKKPLRLIGIAQGIPSSTFLAIVVTAYGNAADVKPPGA
jgi:hypothetical protein